MKLSKDDKLTLMTKIINRLIAMTAVDKEHNPHATDSRANGTVNVIPDFGNGRIRVEAPPAVTNASPSYDLLLFRDLTSVTRDYHLKYPGEERISLKTSDEIVEEYKTGGGWKSSWCRAVTIKVTIKPPKDESIIGVLQLYLLPLITKTAEPVRKGDRIRITGSGYSGWIDFKDMQMEMILTRYGARGENADFLNIGLGHLDHTPPEIFLKRINRAIEIADTINKVVTSLVLNEIPVPLEA